MGEDSQYFLENFGVIKFNYSVELIQLIQSGEANCICRCDPEEAFLYQGIYEGRARRFKRNTDVEGVKLCHDFEDLAINLKTYSKMPCSIWIFETSKHRYTMFEIVTKKLVIGGFRVDI